MSDIKLFRYQDGQAVELAGKAATVEKALQTLLEGQMEVFLGVRLLASEYETGKIHRGRIDSLGLDENGCPVIIEYKRHINENVINQGLFYLDWLLDHKAEFRWLVMEKIGKEAADKIEWTGTRLLCIASDFTKYDAHAVSQINRNIELIRYRLFDKDLLLLELVNAVTGETSGEETDEPKSVPAHKGDKTFAEQKSASSPQLLALYEQVKLHILAQGDDITEKPLKLYVAFRRLRNFVCATLYAKAGPPGAAVAQAGSDDLAVAGRFQLRHDQQGALGHRGFGASHQGRRNLCPGQASDRAGLPGELGDNPDILIHHSWEGQMHTTFEAIIEPNGRIRALEPISVQRPVRALLTILEEDLPRVEGVKLPAEAVGSDFSSLIASLAEFPADFMATGREQPALQEREDPF
jgi:hypothetical protein